MEISQYIKNLLVSNERIILRGFGAFITKQVSAKYDASTGTMKPPFKIVTFDKNIQEDAGLLSEHISRQENITKDASDEQINEYVKTIKSKLASGQTIEFKDLGTFNQSSEGSLDFAFLSEDNLLLNSFGLPSFSVDKKETQTPTTPKAEPKPKVKKKEPIKKVKPKVEKKKTPNPEKNTKNKKRRKLPIFFIFIAGLGLILAAIYFFKPDLWAKGYNFSTEKIASVKQMFNKEDKINYDIIDPDNNDDSHEIVDNKTNSNSDYENYTDEDDIEDGDDEYDNNEVDQEEIENVEDIKPSEEDNIDNEVVEETPKVIATVETNTEISLAQKGNYYIIVGSVKTEADSKKEQKRFSKKGISTSVIKAGKNRYRISIGKFSTAKKANNYYSEIQSKHGKIDAWVWQKK